ncbi:UNVERIFIED_CONTAM: hypothetical protein K2H54_004843 [Gekko kuhli]
MGRNDHLKPKLIQTAGKSIKEHLDSATLHSGALKTDSKMATAPENAAKTGLSTVAAEDILMHIKAMEETHLRPHEVKVLKTPWYDQQYHAGGSSKTRGVAILFSKMEDVSFWNKEKMQPDVN